jgi:hypothetical protein
VAHGRPLPVARRRGGRADGFEEDEVSLKGDIWKAATDAKRLKRQMDAVFARGVGPLHVDPFGFDELSGLRHQIARLKEMLGVIAAPPKAPKRRSIVERELETSRLTREDIRNSARRLVRRIEPLLEDLTDADYGLSDEKRELILSLAELLHTDEAKPQRPALTGATKTK